MGKTFFTQEDKEFLIKMRTAFLNGLSASGFGGYIFTTDWEQFKFWFEIEVIAGKDKVLRMRTRSYDMRLSAADFSDMFFAEGFQMGKEILSKLENANCMRQSYTLVKEITDA